MYYLQNLAYIELYCDHSKQCELSEQARKSFEIFSDIQYSQCLELIDANELQELVYEECELNIKDDCLYA